MFRRHPPFCSHFIDIIAVVPLSTRGGRDFNSWRPEFNKQLCKITIENDHIFAPHTAKTG
jgi:hypothetical protein